MDIFLHSLLELFGLEVIFLLKVLFELWDEGVSLYFL